MEQITRHIDHLPLYDVAGPQQAFPLVLIHGAAWTRSMWLPQIEALSDQFRVIALDLPGHGALRGQSFNFTSAVHSVMENIRQETQEPALIVGLSLGGYVAMACAHDHPESVAALVLSGCCIDYRGAIGFFSHLDSSLVTALFSERRLSQMQEKMLRKAFPEQLVEPQISAGFSWKVMPQVYRELAAHDFRALLKTFAGPVLIINGENDRLNRARETKLAEAAQNGQVQIVKQAGHLCNLEQPEAFTEQLRAFARHCSSTTSAPGTVG